MQIRLKLYPDGMCRLQVKRTLPLERRGAFYPELSQGDVEATLTREIARMRPTPTQEPA